MTKRSVTKTPRGENPQTADSPDYLGPDWSKMTDRQRYLYRFPGGLSQAELDLLWGDVSEEADDAA